jgi:hypothetical protein
MDDRNIETFEHSWREHQITIRFERKFLGTSLITAHLQIESADRTPLPITETGYKSHFMSAETIDAEGGPVAYVQAWLEDAAKSADWLEAEIARAQLTLF